MNSMFIELTTGWCHWGGDGEGYTISDPRKTFVRRDCIYAIQTNPGNLSLVFLSSGRTLDCAESPQEIRAMLDATPAVLLG